MSCLRFAAEVRDKGDDEAADEESEQATPTDENEEGELQEDQESLTSIDDPASGMHLNLVTARSNNPLSSKITHKGQIYAMVGHEAAELTNTRRGTLLSHWD